MTRVGYRQSDFRDWAWFAFSAVASRGRLNETDNRASNQDGRVGNAGTGHARITVAEWARLGGLVSLFDTCRPTVSERSR